jgi:hypothetical protein
MFQFPAYSSLSGQFRNPRIKARLQLPEAYRSLPRLSSQPKPSHPSNSLSSSIITFQILGKPSAAYLIENNFELFSQNDKRISSLTMFHFV